jgi:hypothetical protein
VETSETSAKSFLQLAYSVSHKGGTSVLVMQETLLAGGLNFVKAVHMICVNFIKNIIMVAEEKKEALLSYHPSYVFNIVFII